MINYYYIEKIDPGCLARASVNALCLNENGEWEEILSLPYNARFAKLQSEGENIRDPLFPTWFDLYPEIDSFVKGKISELNETKDGISLLFKYRSNFTYGVGYTTDILGKLMTINEFYSEITNITNGNVMSRL